MPDKSPCCGAEVTQLMGKDEVPWDVCSECMMAIRPSHKPMKEERNDGQEPAIG